MFIAGSYMLYAPPPGTAPYPPPPTPKAFAIAAEGNKKLGGNFSVADILDREFVPKTAACVVVSRGQSSVSAASPLAPSSVNSKDLKFGVDRILSSEMSPRKEVMNSLAALVPSSSPMDSASCSACVTSISRCCPVTSACRCSRQVVEPYPLYAYPTLAMTGQPLLSYPSLYGGSLVDGSASLHHHHPGAQQSQHPVGKRKRSWSRAVFSSLQRKGLEKRFQIQKYITKPDRRQLAATLGLKDAQVKVWFQNRRMKWRHSKEARDHLKKKDELEITAANEENTNIDIVSADSNK